MIPAYLALSSPRASFSQCDASSSSSAERSVKHRTRIINYRGSPMRGRCENKLSRSLLPSRKNSFSLNERQRMDESREIITKMCATAPKK